MQSYLWTFFISVVSPWISVIFFVFAEVSLLALGKDSRTSH